ncbi:MAG TPA: HAMP domain-containing sensor histidine kinase [Burkholderiaceae bacterium]|nr:HAMP domain-containing sensor histidine kinase [Burkholderiaceae bacterium]
MPEPRRWHQRARQRVARSLRWRLVLLFWLLAAAMSAVFLVGLQRALGGAWRGAAEPLVADYTDRLARDIGSPPDTRRAQALAEQLHLAITISGPTVQWRSHPVQDERWGGDAGRASGVTQERRSADGHLIRFRPVFEPAAQVARRTAFMTLALLLALTALAYLYVRHLLGPLEDIRAGAQRFGAGRFAEPIPELRPDELGQLACDVNQMAARIHDMLEAKRGLLLAISHELRSPLTRARLNAELLPETGESSQPREALLRDLALMRDLIADLLESERLGQGHAALQRENLDLAALLHASADEARAAGQALTLDLRGDLSAVPLDRARVQLLLRNLLGNAARHASAAPRAVELSARREDGEGAAAVVLTVRDHGPGAPPDVLARMGEAFYRADAARTRRAGPGTGVGLGLYLCRLVCEAHGGRLELADAPPGLAATAWLPLNNPAPAANSG